MDISNSNGKTYIEKYNATPKYPIKLQGKQPGAIMGTVSTI